MVYSANAVYTQYNYILKYFISFKDNGGLKRGDAKCGIFPLPHLQILYRKNLILLLLAIVIIIIGICFYSSYRHAGLANNFIVSFTF